MTTSDSPVVVTAYFYPRSDVRDQVLAALQPAIAAVHEEDGCELYAIHDAPDGSIVMLEKWTSAELLDAHGRASRSSGSTWPSTGCWRRRSRSPDWSRGRSGSREGALWRGPQHCPTGLLAGGPAPAPAAPPTTGR